MINYGEKKWNFISKLSNIHTVGGLWRIKASNTKLQHVKCIWLNTNWASFHYILPAVYRCGLNGESRSCDSKLTSSPSFGFVWIPSSPIFRFTGQSQNVFLTVRQSCFYQFSGTLSMFFSPVFPPRVSASFAAVFQKLNGGYTKKVCKVVLVGQEEGYTILHDMILIALHITS